MIIDNTTYRSPDYRSNARSQGIDMLVLHSTETTSLSETAKCFTSETDRNVSCHYVVDRNGRIYQFVPESRAANHAGKSSWRLQNGQEATNINARSVGIEFQRGAGETFTPAQIQAGLELSKNITARYGIDSANVVGHSDIAPGRKSDPGNDFPWELFAQNGLAANANRRGGDGRGSVMDPTLMAAAQNGAFNLENKKTTENTLAQVQNKSDQQKAESPKTETQDIISTLLMSGMGLLTNSGNPVVAGLATLISSSGTALNGTASGSNTSADGLLPKLTGSSILGDSPIGSLIGNASKIGGKGYS